ncbi:MAG: ribonuclease H-like domain-containing protein [Chloroflexota bacterium]
MSTATVARRLATFRAAGAGTGDVGSVVDRAKQGGDLAARLAAAVGGSVIASPAGAVVWLEGTTRPMPIDRDRLASLPGQPPAGVPLVCLDTETTGLATAAGTLAFLIGLGWWEGDWLRQVQLLLPDHADEPALLDLLSELLPQDAWLVTYNGRGFDWPLLVARYRMARRPAPTHAGHLDLLPVVRRLFRHRMDDARLKTVETMLLGVQRHRDVEGWQIPTLYLDFLRGGPAGPLVDVVRHNDEDVRSLARLLAHLDVAYGDRIARQSRPRGDLAGLARSFVRAGRTAEALDCLEDAALHPIPLNAAAAAGRRVAEVPWWSPRARPDFGGRGSPPPMSDALRDQSGYRWTDERLAAERARILARLGRPLDAADAWQAAAADRGVLAIVAWIEIAKIREHRLREPVEALDACRVAGRLLERSRALGRPHARLEADLARRAARLRRRLAAADQRRLSASEAIRAATSARLGTPCRPGRSTTRLATAAESRSATSGLRAAALGRGEAATEPAVRSACLRASEAAR